MGRGGFGFVYQAQDTLLRDEVAIKELIPALVGDEATLKRFLVEARATMELAPEHIVRTHNVFQESGNYYTVMECMSGGSLEERRARSPCPCSGTRWWSRRENLSPEGCKSPNGLGQSQGGD